MERISNDSMNNCLNLLDRITEKYLGKETAKGNVSAFQRAGPLPVKPEPVKVPELRKVAGRRYLYHKGNVLPQEVRDYVVRELKKGQIYRVIAVRAAISTTTVSVIAHEEGLNRGKGGPGMVRGERAA